MNFQARAQISLSWNVRAFSNVVLRELITRWALKGGPAGLLSKIIGIWKSEIVLECYCSELVLLADQEIFGRLLVLRDQIHLVDYAWLVGRTVLRIVFNLFEHYFSRNPPNNF